MFEAERAEFLKGLDTYTVEDGTELKITDIDMHTLEVDKYTMSFEINNEFVIKLDAYNGSIIGYKTWVPKNDELKMEHKYPKQDGFVEFVERYDSQFTKIVIGLKLIELAKLRNKNGWLYRKTSVTDQIATRLGMSDEEREHFIKEWTFDAEKAMSMARARVSWNDQIRRLGY